MRIHDKDHEINIRHLQKDVEIRVTQAQLSEVIALINGGIQTDPNIMKLLKTKEVGEEETDKIKMNAGLFSRKLNQISESLTILMSSIRKV